jgi:hypothetical protein
MDLRLLLIIGDKEMKTKSGRILLKDSKDVDQTILPRQSEQGSIWGDNHVNR